MHSKNPQPVPKDTCHTCDAPHILAHCFALARAQLIESLDRDIDVSDITTMMVRPGGAL